MSKSLIIDVPGFDVIHVPMEATASITQQGDHWTIFVSEDLLRRIPDRRVCEEFVDKLGNQLGFEILARWEESR
jgi:hypothetical protein